MFSVGYNDSCFSLKNPAKFVGRKPRKYTVPVPVPLEPSGSIVSGAARASGRSQSRQGVGGDIAAQAAAAAQVRTYRDNGVKHSNSSYNRVSSDKA